MLRKGDDTGSYFRTDDPGEPTTGKPRLSITDEEANILRALAAGRFVTEIGTGLGVSTRALAETAVRVETYDIDPWVREHVWPDLVADYANVAVIEAWEDLGPYHVSDLVFIDGDHATESVAADIARAQDFGAELIVCHDANYVNVRRAIPEGWTFIDTEHGIAWGR